MQIAKERKKQILIVEDEGLIAADIQQRLERMGYSARRSRGQAKKRCGMSGPPRSIWCSWTSS